jgi:hypothetical protein
MAIWPAQTFVDFDRAIDKAISEIRRVLGDEAGSPRFVEAFSKRGYRFIGFVDREHARYLPPGDLDAYTACLRGRYLWSLRTVEGLRGAIEQFQRAITIDGASPRRTAASPTPICSSASGACSLRRPCSTPPARQPSERFTSTDGWSKRARPLQKSRTTPRPLTH